MTNIRHLLKGEDMANNILVIGNGYDLAHELKTGYNNFIECIKYPNRI